MSPYPEYAPSGFSQVLCDSTISFFVALQLRNPIRTVALRIVAMIWASMPETSINKHSEALANKYKIGTAVKWMTPSPAFDAVHPEYFDQCEFGFTISARTYGRHYTAAFSLRYYVWHT